MNTIVSKNQHLMDHAENFTKILEIMETSILHSDYPVLEIGTNMGGSCKCFLEVLKKNNKNNYFIGVDPYGAIDYHNGAFLMHDSFYENKRYYAAMTEIFQFVKENDVPYTHFKATSEEFINYIYPNIKLHNSRTSNKFEKFSFIFLDGSHDPEVVKKEMEFFKDKLDKNCFMIVDDWEGNRFGNFLEIFVKDSPIKVNEELGISARLVLQNI